MVGSVIAAPSPKLSPLLSTDPAGVLVASSVVHRGPAKRRAVTAQLMRSWSRSRSSGTGKVVHRPAIGFPSDNGAGVCAGQAAVPAAEARWLGR